MNLFVIVLYFWIEGLGLWCFFWKYVGNGSCGSRNEEIFLEKVEDNLKVF